MKSLENITYRNLTPQDQVSETEKLRIAQFLFDHLENYGDPINHILNCLNYASSSTDSKGGFIVLAEEKGDIIGAVIMNNTGMKGYIPENILVYIAVHKDHRGKGIGKQLMLNAITSAKGAIALHVEPDNPARFLYEKLGFNSKYLEMRITN